jgi:hypothetical protein
MTLRRDPTAGDVVVRPKRDRLSLEALHVAPSWRPGGVVP